MTYLSKFHPSFVINTFAGGNIDWSMICRQSSKVITFVDLAGHEKYLKTTVFGMTGHLPDFCMLMVLPCYLGIFDKYRITLDFNRSEVMLVS